MEIPKSLVLTVPTLAKAISVVTSLSDRGYDLTKTGLLMPDNIRIHKLVGKALATTAVRLARSPGVLAAGPIAASAGRAKTVTGTLRGFGVSASAARRYEGKIREGSILIGVRPRTAEDANHFIEVLSFDPHGTGGGEDD